MDKIICVFGDSIAWGAVDPEGGGWVTRLRNHFESEGLRVDLDIEIYNLGISGNTTSDLLSRIEGEARSRKPNFIMFAIGINDAQFIHSTNSIRVSLDDFQQNLVKLLAIAKKFTDKVAFVGLTTVDESKTRPILWTTDRSYTNENIKRLDSAIEKFCHANTLEFVPMDGVITHADLLDGVHPNSAGHQKIFEAVKQFLDDSGLMK